MLGLQRSLPKGLLNEKHHPVLHLSDSPLYAVNKQLRQPTRHVMKRHQDATVNRRHRNRHLRNVPLRHLTRHVMKRHQDAQVNRRHRNRHLLNVPLRHPTRHVMKRHQDAQINRRHRNRHVLNRHHELHETKALLLPNNRNHRLQVVRNLVMKFLCVKNR